MPPEAPLDPENRALYAEILRAPAGFDLDAALGTTYTFDFETALVIPATLAFHAAENRQETLDTPLALLEGLERLAARIAIFCEAGRIKAVPKGANRLTALLEDTVTEVAAPGGGAFHPKIWALRFRAIEGAQTRLRVALLSRNLTSDTAWDLSLCLDGVPGDAPVPENEALRRLLAALPDLAEGRATPAASRAIAEGLAADLASAQWDCPAGVTSVGFAVNGLGDSLWQPRIGRTLGIVSPFVTDGALARLARGVSADRAILLGRGEELALMTPATLERFGRVLVLDELAETEDGEDAEAPAFAAVPTRGLHAKAFMTERYSTTEITLGSGNATTAALLDGANVEVFATLAGPSRVLGTVEEQFSSDRLGRYLREFRPPTLPDRTDEKAAERRIDEVRRRLAASSLSLGCREVEPNRIALTLHAGTPVEWPEPLALRIWPLVVGSDNGVDVSDLAAPADLGRIALRDVTRWLGVTVRDRESGLAATFSLGTRLDGLPDRRNAEILRSVVENREAFLRYIRLLLGNVSDSAKALFAAGRGGVFDGPIGAGADAPILEDMVRALSGDGRQLRDIERLVERLGEAEDGAGDPVIPAEFRALWQTFRTLMDEDGSRRRG